jgi:hypothetical protein
MKINWLILLAASLIPMVIGFLWYNPKTLGNAWMKACGLDEEKIKGANMPLIFGLTFVCSFFIAIGINFMVIHQFHLGSILMNEPGFMEKGTEMNNFYLGFMEKYGNNFRTFKHGALHGTIGGFFLATPIITTNALFERKGFAYIAINSGYWIISMALMGGVICAFA